MASSVGNWVSWSKAIPPTENVLATHKGMGCPRSFALNTASTAKTVLIAYTVAPQAIQANETAAQNRLTIVLRVNLTTKDQDGELQIQSPFTISRFAVYEADQDLSSVESSLLEEINDQFVQDIINKLNTL